MQARFVCVDVELFDEHEALGKLIDFLSLCEAADAQEEGDLAEEDKLLVKLEEALVEAVAELVEVYEGHELVLRRVDFVDRLELALVEDDVVCADL